MTLPIPDFSAQRDPQSGMARRNRPGSLIEPDQGSRTSWILHDQYVGILCHVLRSNPPSYLFFFFFLTADFFFDFFAVALRLAAIGPSSDGSGNDRLARSQRLSTLPSSPSF
jgi:hypothetical protein